MHLETQKNKIFRLAFFVFFGIFALLGLLLQVFPMNLSPLRAVDGGNSCADITFGTSEYSSTSSVKTTSFATMNFTVTGVTSTSCNCLTDNGTSLTSSARIGTSGVGGTLVFTFPSLRITKVKVLAYKFATDSAKTPLCQVTTSAQTTLASQAVNLLSAPDISSASTEPGLVFTNLDNGGSDSTSLTISSTSSGRFNLCKIVLTIGNSSPVTSSESSPYSSGPSGTPLKVYAIEQTGQYGDCTLFKYGDYEALFDFGNTFSQAQLAEALSTYVTDHVLDLVVLTHPHTDHYGGVYGGTTAATNGGTLIDGGITQVSKILDNGADSYGTTYQGSWVNGVRQYWINHGTAYQPIENVVSSHMYDALWDLSGPLRVQWLDTSAYPTPGSSGPSDANDGSIACDMKFGSYDFILCGDLPSTPEKTLVANYQAHPFVDSGNTVVYKACHHCSSTANCTEFMDFLSPSYAFTESGIEDGNSTSAGIKSQQHPYKDARARIEAKTGTNHLWWVGTCGTLEMTLASDCSSFSVHGQGRRFGQYYVNGVLVDPASEKDTPLELTQWALNGY